MIQRIRPVDNYTLIDNQPLQETEMSWKAKGLLAYLMSLPDDWKISMSDLCNRSKDGRDATNSAMNELIEFGYAKRMTLKEGTQFAGIDYCVSSVKFTDFPDTGNPLTGNPQLLITNITKEPITNNIEKNEKETIFENSEVYDIEKFRERMQEEAKLNIDVHYYYHVVKDWTAGLRARDKRKYRTARGWIATARNMMRNDKKQGKLKMCVNSAKENDLKSYLNL
jgi:hypothetical protein